MTLVLPLLAYNVVISSQSLFLFPSFGTSIGMTRIIPFTKCALEHDVLSVTKVHTTRGIEVNVVCQLTDFERSRIKRTLSGV